METDRGFRIGRHGRHLGDGKLFEHRWRQCERERGERGDREVGTGKHRERKEKEREMETAG